jgi:hypothetical protein
MNTVAVPLAGVKDPATLYIATDTPLRIVVRNVGPAVLFLAFDSADLASLTPGLAGQFQLPPDRSEVFVLAPKQGIYAVSFGGKGIVSFSVSEAFPQALEP